MLISLLESFSLSNSTYNITFSFFLVANLFFRLFTSKVKFPIFRFIIAMVWNNSTASFVYITSTTTSSTYFGVLVCVIGFLDPSIYDPNSYTIILPNSNSNGNPSIDFGLLGDTCSFASLNTSKAGCVATFSVSSLVACRPSCVYYGCCYKCCSKCSKCCGLLMVSIQSSYTFPSKCKCFSPFGNLVLCSSLTS
jgi:hypothetical protein